MEFDTLHPVDADGPGLDLVNSENWFTLGPGSDRLLSDPAWLDEFLERWDLALASPVSPKQRRELVRLRTVLCALADAATAGEPLPAPELSELNEILAAAPVRRRLVEEGDAFGVEFGRSAAGWSGVLGEIAASFAELLARGRRERLKRCENPECRWLFYDRGKNLRRRWCDPAVCGNRDKVRRFRARRRSGV